jgi:hypothetical protein
MKTNPIRWLLTWSAYFAVGYAMDLVIAWALAMRPSPALILGLAVISAAVAVLITNYSGGTHA